MLTWTQAFLNARITRSGNTQYFCTESERQNVSSAMVPTSLNITTNLHGVTKQTIKLIPQDLKFWRANLTLTCSNALTIKASIKLTWTLVPSKSIALTMIGTTKNNKNFTRAEVTQFAQLWAALKHDFRKNQDILTEHLKEQLPYQYHTWNTLIFWYHLHPGTVLVNHTIHPKLF